jgi:hypothetical protein
MSQDTKKGPSPTELLAAAAAIAAGTQAYGEVVIFINPDEGEPGHFDWDVGDEFAATSWLDITRPSADQAGLLDPRSVGQIGSHQIGYGGGASFWWNRNSRLYDGGHGAWVAAEAPGYNSRTIALPGGETIDGRLNFNGISTHAGATSTQYYGYIVWSNFAAGEASYMGVRFSDMDGYHYGWIGVVRPDPLGIDLDAFAWGYETEPGVPIIAGIPAPGTLAALAFGAAVTRRGRKRKDD